jgi:hypothetical protein
VSQGETTSVGTDFYNGGDFFDQNHRMLGSYTIVTQTFTNVTDSPSPVNLNSGMVVLQLFFTGQGQGQGSRIQESLVLMGAAQFNDTPPTLPVTPGQRAPGRPLPRAQGSVAAATPAHAGDIDHQWRLENTTQLIIV